MFESTKIIAYKQYFKARELFMDEASMQQLRGPVRFIHEHVDMTQQVVPLYKSIVDLAKHQSPTPQIQVNSSYHTCKTGLGYSFAAGTTDGPGFFDFQQGDTASSRYWNMVRNFLRRPSDEQTRCHHPKPILLSTGEMDFPYMWHPKVVPTQILMIGQLAIVGLPGEFTTMAGRRVRNVVLDTLTHSVPLEKTTTNLHEHDPMVDEDEGEDSDSGESETLLPGINSDGDDDDDGNSESIVSGESNVHKKKQLKRIKRAYSMANEIKVVLSGLSNIYTSYITTVEEYEIQRYEGASTLYGPHTLQAYVNQFKKLATYLLHEKSLPSDNQPQPPDLTKSLFTLKPGVIFDGTQHGKPFGSVLNDVNSTKIYRCQDTVSVSFVAGNPRNDPRHEDSFLYVDKYISNGDWMPIATDASWETKFIWERTNTLLGESTAKIVWEIPHNCETGVYRIRHYGSHKNLLQTVSPYSGRSSFFKVSKDAISMDQTQLQQLDALYKSAVETNNLLLLNQKRLEEENQQHSYSESDKKTSLLYSPINYLGSLFGWRSHR